MVGVRLFIVAQVFELRAQRRPFVKVDEGEEAQAARRQVDPFIVAADLIGRRQTVGTELAPSPEPAVVAVDLDIGIRAFLRNRDFLLLQGRRLFHRPFRGGWR